MKKFKFTLAPLYKFRKSSEKRLRLEYANAVAQLDMCRAEKEALRLEWEENAKNCRAEMARGVSVDIILIYSNYFSYLKEAEENADKKIARAQLAVEKKRAELAALLRELKTLENLYKEQYAAYQAEVTKQEETELGDILSYQTAVSEE